MKDYDNTGSLIAYIRFRQQELERIDKMLSATITKERGIIRGEALIIDEESNKSSLFNIIKKKINKHIGSAVRPQREEIITHESNASYYVSVTSE